MWLLFLAALFTPSAEFFHSELDGAWQFGEVIERVGLDVETEALVENSELVELNNPDEPDFLVNNRFDWLVEGNGRPSWLEMEYQPWSEETEPGFDEPTVVIFLDEELIFKRNIAEICCELQQATIYLGELVGEHRLSFLAGETGDLQKPSGVIVTAMKILVQKETAARKLEKVELNAAEPETIVTGNSTPSIEVDRLDSAAETIITESPGDGQVLGTADAQEGQSQLSDWQLKLKTWLAEPWLIGLAWVMTVGLIWLVIRDKKPFVTPNVRLGLKNILSTKKQKGTL